MNMNEDHLNFLLNVRGYSIAMLLFRGVLFVGSCGMKKLIPLLKDGEYLIAILVYQTVPMLRTRQKRW